MIVSDGSILRGALAGATAVVLLAIGIPSAAHATVTAGSSYAAGEAVNLDFTPIIGVAATITSGPLPTFSAASPGAYGSSNTVLGVNVADVLSTGVLTAGGVSNVNGGAGSRSNDSFCAGRWSVASVGAGPYSRGKHDPLYRRCQWRLWCVER